MLKQEYCDPSVLIYYVDYTVMKLCSATFTPQAWKVLLYEAGVLYLSMTLLTIY